ncbi:MAG: hexokinase [Spirochaetes bacterium]|nr:hexokinase [Spirochaetota bacterium]
MDKIEKRVIEFLKSCHMDYEDVDIETYTNIFLEEMELGLAGRESSLQMIPTYIDVDKEIPLNEPVIVLDAGGTNFRIASVHFNEEKKPVIKNLKKYFMPGYEGKVSKEEFFRIIAEYIEDFLDLSRKIGFCFSYPVEILPDKDGRLIHFSKEIKAREVEGELVGRNLVSAIRSRGYKDKKHIVLLNDTVATLLAGRSAFLERDYGSYVGFILGTGTNCCYIEKNSNIKKSVNLDINKNQIINVESGNFGKSPKGTIDDALDKATINPGKYTFEKKISGAYFGKLCLGTIQLAADNSLFSTSANKKLKAILSLGAKDINDFMLYPAGVDNPLASSLGDDNDDNDDDRSALFYIIDRLIERAAKLTAINLSSVVIKSDKGKNPCYPVCITADGTVFHGLKTLKEKVEYYLRGFLIKSMKRYYEFVSVENAPLIGAAIAGLTN